MAWILLTQAHLEADTAELSTIKSILLPDGQTAEEVIAEELRDTAMTVRGYCPNSTMLGEGLTVPEELKKTALAMARIAVFTRIAALKRFITEDRRKEAENALTRLRDWQRGAFNVIPATTLNNDQPPGPAVTFKARQRRASSAQTDGL